jgi:acyl-coenzyme A thioesterase PaaI-like protein
MLHKQPNSRLCFACGLENTTGLQLCFYDNGKDEVTCDFVIADHHQGYPGIAQGGIVAAVLDEVGGRTVMIGNPNRFFMTLKLEIKFRQPVPVRMPLRGVGRLLRLKSKSAAARAEIVTGDGVVLAEAELLLADVPDGLLSIGEVDRLGWRVYPDDPAA